MDEARMLREIPTMIHKPTRLLIALLLAATPIALGAPLVAAGGPHGRPGADGGPILDEGRMDRLAEHQAERLTRALDLTAAQQTTLARLQAELEATLRPLAEGMRTAHQELRTLLDGDSPDPAAVGAQAIAIDRARDSMRAGWESFETTFAAILTESQRAAFRVLQETRPEHGPFGEHRGPRGAGGPVGPGGRPRH